MKSFSSILAAVAASLPLAYAADWHFITFWAPSGAEFIEVTGTMTVPPIPQAATYYLWPGLQPTDNSGVYQNVLDGRTGSWAFGSGWCCSSKGRQMSL